MRRSPSGPLTVTRRVRETVLSFFYSITKYEKENNISLENCVATNNIPILRNLYLSHNGNTISN